MVAFKTTSNSKLTLVITDRSNIFVFDTTHNQIKPLKRLCMGFYIVGNSKVNQEFIPVQSYDTKQIYEIKSSHINHGILTNSISLLHN